MAIILVIFFFSGAASLVYEVVWMRNLALIFGVSTYATATVLATYMGGLAIGSFLFGRFADRSPRPLRVYALLEIAIGIYALCVPLLFGALRSPYVALYQLDLPYAGLALGRAVLGAAVLLPPTILMGGTLPVLAAFFIRRSGDVGLQTGRLYFVNTAGAVFGCTLAGFALIEHLGMIGTTRVGVATNFALAAATLLLDRRVAAQRPASDAAPVGPGGEPAAAGGPGLVRLVLWAIAISGFTSLAYEVFWTRALLRYLYNSTYAFTAMLSVFLAGIAIGSWLHTHLPYRTERPVRVFAVLEALVGLGFLASLLLFPGLRDTSSLLLGDVMHSFGDSILMLSLRAGLILFLPAVFLGAAVPLATQIAVQRLATVGQSVGRVYGINTLGAIVGSLAASFILIPMLGMQGTLLLLVAVNLALATALALADLPGARHRLAVCAAALCVLAAAAFANRHDVFRETFSGSQGGELVFYKEGATDTVGVVERDGQRAIVYEDQRGTAATWSFSWNYVLGHLPVLLHPGHPKTGLHICFGVGNSLSAMAAHESMETVDSVELSPHVLEAGRYFWTNDGVVDHPKVRHIIDDGRNFVMATDRSYDVIVLEPPETFTAGVINLYTREFYQDLERRLAPGGVVMQWIPVGGGTLDDERRLFRSFFEVFPNGTVWQLLARDGNILLVGTREPLRIDYALLREKFREPRIRRDFELAGVRDEIDVLSMFIWDSETFGRFVEDSRPVIDDHTQLDFSMPRFVGSGFGTGSFAARVEADGTTPFRTMMERALFYYQQRGSVVPLLTNLDGRDRRVLERKIRRRERPDGFSARINIPESEWNRWPAPTSDADPDPGEH